jgi:hypothetical protein
MVSIVTRERSGSTVFQRFLGTNSSFDLLGELWNMGSAGAAFYPFWKKKILEDDKNLRLNSLGPLFNEFIEERLAASPGGVVFDAKYGHLDNLRYFWLPKFDETGRPTIAEPTLLRDLKKRGSHIIHLTRRNKLAVYVSTLRARETGVWQRPRNTGPSKRPVEKLDFKIEEMVEFVKQERNMDALVAGYLKSYQRHLPLVYEEFLPKDTERLSEGFVRTVAGFLGEKPGRFDPVLRLRKVIQGTLAEQLALPDEVRAALSAIDGAWMLEEES